MDTIANDEGPASAPEGVEWTGLLVEALAVYDAAIQLFDRFDLATERSESGVRVDSINEVREQVEGVVALVDELIRYHVASSDLRVMSPLRLQHVRDDAAVYARDAQL